MKRVLLALISVGCGAAAAFADDPKDVNVQVFPGEVELSTDGDRQSIVVQATTADNVTRDVTDEAEYSIADTALVRRQGHVLYPVSDGRTEMTVRFGGQTRKVPITVKDAKKDRPISFKLDVMPVFMKSGCNSGACHGAARGKDGFRLSLFGYDPDGDEYRLTHEMSGRRVSLALPHESLLAEKATGQVPHTGGERFKPDSERYATLIRWLEAGAPKDPPETPKPVRLEILPPRLVLEGQGTIHRTTVRAAYSDGTDRDVTSLALFLSNNETSAKIDENGRVTAGRRGEAYVFARFATFTVGSQVIVVPKGVPYEWPDVPEHNSIDTLVFQKLKKLRLLPSEVCRDETFLRRACLDIVGTLPSPEEVERFLDDSHPDKRERLVDELLDRKEFVDMWVMKWSELLEIHSSDVRGTSYKATLLYQNWLRDKIAHDVPFHRMIQELLTSTGGTFTHPAANYYQIEQDTLKIAENVAQVFLGMRIQCAQCHNHPFDRWTMDDYYGFAAFFSQIGRKGAEDPREQIIFNRGSGEVNHPVGGRAMAPRFLGGDAPDVNGKDRRVVLAQWLASPDNPYFARNLADIVWAHFFGPGIIDPVDDVRVSNPPSNPELLDELARRLIAYNYDFKRLVRDICTSHTYQLSTQPNATNDLDTRNFSKGPIRRVRAEVLLDIISQVTETKNKFKGLPLGARAVEIADGNFSTYFLTTFGRATRQTVCSCEVKMEPNLSQALHLLNGDTVNQRIQQGGVVKRLLGAGKTAGQILEELHLRCLSRKPTRKELDKLLPLMKPDDGKELQQKLEDAFWALLNSNEFVFNH